MSGCTEQPHRRAAQAKTSTTDALGPCTELPAPQRKGALPCSFMGRPHVGVTLVIGSHPDTQSANGLQASTRVRFHKRLQSVFDSVHVASGLSGAPVLLAPPREWWVGRGGRGGRGSSFGVRFWEPGVLSR